MAGAVIVALTTFWAAAAAAEELCVGTDLLQVGKSHVAQKTAMEMGKAQAVPLTVANMYRTTHDTGKLNTYFTHHDNGSVEVVWVTGMAIRREAWTAAGVTDWSGPWAVQLDFVVLPVQMHWITDFDRGGYVNFYLNTNVQNFGDGTTTGETGSYWCQIFREATTKEVSTCSSSMGAMTVLSPADCSFSGSALTCTEAFKAQLMNKLHAKNTFSFVVRRLQTGEINFKLLSGANGASEGDTLEWEIQSSITVSISDSSTVMPINVYEQYTRVLYNRFRGNDGDVILADTGGRGSAFGDPHIKNVLGQQFDVRQPGSHVLLEVPKGAVGLEALFRVEALVEPVGTDCDAMYLRAVSIAGRWLGDVPPLRFFAGTRADGAAPSAALFQVGTSGNMTAAQFAEVVPRSLAWVAALSGGAPPAAANRHTTSMEANLKVGPGVLQKVTWVLERAPSGKLVDSLWLSVTNLGAAKVEVGGLIGTDGHEDAARAPRQCRQASGGASPSKRSSLVGPQHGTFAISASLGIE